MNRVCLSGYLTRDSEYTDGEVPRVNFTVAVNSYSKGKEIANFIRCVMFGARTTKLADMLKKGTRVAVDGKLSQRTVERDGQRREYVSVMVDDLELLGHAKPKTEELSDSDIPF